jgi:vanillate O-demethylase monooxygenase subunit
MDPLNNNKQPWRISMYPKNTWYVACTPDEIAGKPLGRQICGEKMVFYRGHEGKVAAVEDFCPHRGAPLSLGYVENGNLVCGYHGLVMGCDGRTVEMPGQRVRGFPCNKTFAVVERYGFIWVWPGDQALADPALIHHLEWAVSDEWAYGGGLFHIQCDYRLMIDNLMDLTHETYVHASSIGQKEIDEAPPVTTVEGDEVVTARHMDNIMAPPFWRMALPLHPAQPCADRSRRGPCRPWWLSGSPAVQGVEHRRRLHHAGNRDLDLVLLGHGAQLQSAG